jgi:hypothetical protein
MKTVSQNCRGLGNQPAVRSLQALVKAKEPDILFLCETKLKQKEMEYLRWKLDLINMVAVDCVGRSGGLALFWKKGVNVTLRWRGRYHIDAVVEEENGVKWRLTGVYGESKAGEKEKTWRLLRTLHAQSDLSWLCVGDFNEILFTGGEGGWAASSPRLHGGL